MLMRFKKINVFLCLIVLVLGFATNVFATTQLLPVQSFLLSRSLSSEQKNQLLKDCKGYMMESADPSDPSNLSTIFYNPERTSEVKNKQPRCVSALKRYVFTEPAEKYTEANAAMRKSNAVGATFCSCTAGNPGADYIGCLADVPPSTC